MYQARIDSLKKSDKFSEDRPLVITIIYLCFNHSNHVMGVLVLNIQDLINYGAIDLNP